MDSDDNSLDGVSGCSGVIPPAAINVNCADMKKEWRSFRNGFEFYEFASGLRDNDDDIFRVANLLTIVGKETFEIFHSMKLSKKQKSTVAGVLDALEMYFVNGKQVFFVCVLQKKMISTSRLNATQAMQEVDKQVISRKIPFYCENESNYV